MQVKSAIGAISALMACVVFGGAAYARTPRAQQKQQTQQDKKAPAVNADDKATQGKGCSLLTPAMLQKALGQPFEDEPGVDAKAPPAYDGAWGSNCEYSSKKPANQGGLRVEFTIYVEASAAVAKETFDKAAVFFIDRSKPKLSIGDFAYWQTTDDGPAIHVLKGKTHYAFQIDPPNEKQLKDLAAALAAQL